MVLNLGSVDPQGFAGSVAVGSAVNIHNVFPFLCALLVLLCGRSGFVCK